MPKNKLVNIDFNLEWKSSASGHTEFYHLTDVDFKHDTLPSGFKEGIAKLKVGESYTEKIQAKDLLGEGYSSDKVITFKTDLFNTQFKNQHSPPMLYRFYPSAIAWQGLNTTEKDYTPFRLISKNQDEMSADRNHPLAKYYLTLTATKVSQIDSETKEKPRKRNIANLLTSRGPGMQAPFEFGDSIFFDDYPFKRPTINNLSKPFIDTNAQQIIENLYSELLPKHSKIIDILSNDSSYLAGEYETGLLAGIGDVEEILSENKRLDTYTVQDLNENKKLPFETNSFDDAICTLAIETLIDPLALIKEVARVINTNGKFIITFSETYLPDQTISLWGQLHPFERVQLVLEYFQESGLFNELNTFSNRGSSNNAIYAVWGSVN